MNIFLAAGKDLYQFPKNKTFFDKIPRVTWIDLPNNDIHHVLPDISKLTYLQKLSLEGNNIHHLPSTMSNLSYLIHVDLADNNFTIYPSCLKSRQKYLLSVDFHGMPNVILPKWFWNAPLLRKLDLEYNNMNYIPNELKLMSKSLEHLELSFNNISHVRE